MSDGILTVLHVTAPDEQCIAPRHLVYSQDLVPPGGGATCSDCQPIFHASTFTKVPHRQTRCRATKGPRGWRALSPSPTFSSTHRTSRELPRILRADPAPDTAPSRGHVRLQKTRQATPIVPIAPLAVPPPPTDPSLSLSTPDPTAQDPTHPGDAEETDRAVEVPHPQVRAPSQTPRSGWALHRHPDF